MSDRKDHAGIDAIFPGPTHPPVQMGRGDRAGLGRPTQSRDLAGFRCCLSRGPGLFPSCCGSFSRFRCGFNCGRQFQLRLFRSAMVAMVQRLDARSFFSYSQLIVATFLALVLKVFRNRLRCHGQSVADLAPSKLSNFGHSLTIHRPPQTSGWLVPRARTLRLGRVDSQTNLRK